jgi:hypothetical protein
MASSDELIDDSGVLDVFVDASAVSSLPPQAANGSASMIPAAARAIVRFLLFVRFMR